MSDASCGSRSTRTLHTAAPLCGASSTHRHYPETHHQHHDNNYHPRSESEVELHPPAAARSPRNRHLIANYWNPLIVHTHYTALIELILANNGSSFNNNPWNLKHPKFDTFIYISYLESHLTLLSKTGKTLWYY